MDCGAGPMRGGGRVRRRDRGGRRGIRRRASPRGLGDPVRRLLRACAARAEQRRRLPAFADPAAAVVPGAGERALRSADRPVPGLRGRPAGRDGKAARSSAGGAGGERPRGFTGGVEVGLHDLPEARGGVPRRTRGEAEPADRRDRRRARRGRVESPLHGPAQARIRVVDRRGPELPARDRARAGSERAQAPRRGAPRDDPAAGIRHPCPRDPRGRPARPAQRGGRPLERRRPAGDIRGTRSDRRGDLDVETPAGRR